MTFDPHYAIVTASDSGIGKATAVALADAGMDIGVTWHSDSQGAEETAEEGAIQGTQGSGQAVGLHRFAVMRRND